MQKDLQKLKILCTKALVLSQWDSHAHNVSNATEDRCQTPACNGGPPQNCTETKVPDCRTCNGGPPQPCPPQPCPPQPCDPQICPPQPCPPQICPPQPCPPQICPPPPCPPQICPPQPCLPQPCPPQICPPPPCPPQPCPTKDSKDKNLPDCQRCTCDPCSPQTCPPQDCKAENVPDCQTPACNPCPPPGTQDCKEENVSDCQRCDGKNRECPASSEENVPKGHEQQILSCTYFGVSYNHGDSWRSGENLCDICSCSEGQVLCERKQCNIGCRNPAAPPPNSCCPVCDGCGVNGHDFPNGAVTPVGDPCQECTCVDGNVVCSPVHCPALSCHNPVHHAGECCPRCEQCQFESKTYMDGETFTSRRHPCLRCHCSAGKVSCEHMAASCPAPHCSHPAKHRGQCCPTCRECEYEQKVYADGTVFTPAGSELCQECRCKGGNVICQEKRCPPVPCSNPIRDPDRCCPVCKPCVVDGIEYKEGFNWQPEGECSSCTCVDGETLCTPTLCPPTNCHYPTRITGSCCLVCDSCTYNQHVYSNGQRFTLPDHPCYTCTCQDGDVQREKQPCPQPNCRDSYTPPGECCPKCPDP